MESELSNRLYIEGRIPSTYKTIDIHNLHKWLEWWLVIGMQGHAYRCIYTTGRANIYIFRAKKPWLFTQRAYIPRPQCSRRGNSLRTEKYQAQITSAMTKTRYWSFQIHSSITHEFLISKLEQTIYPYFQRGHTPAK